jgi:hypothetical protein
LEEDTRDGCCPHQKEEEMQTHVHEFLGSVKVVPEEDCEDFHNHRFAGVTGEAIFIGNHKHIHKIFTRTDFFDDHFHEICVETLENIPVGCGRHVHFVRGTTTENEDHVHDFMFATLIDDPIGD